MRNIPRLNSSQRTILNLFKYRGDQTIPALAAALELNVETVRGHVKGLIREDLVRREGSISDGPGRPEIIYGLTSDAERLFPRSEPEILRDLAGYLRRNDHRDLLDDFFDEWLAERREEAMVRVAHLEGDERLDEVAAIMSELGFMALAERTDGVRRLRLCHCPLRSLIDETRMPCRAEIGFVKELLGEELTRETYIPAGDASCSYRTPAGAEAR